MVMQAGEKALDRILEEMLKVVKNSKNEIFDINEESRLEYESLQIELNNTKQLVLEYIEKGDNFERKVKASRVRLAEVSKRFDRYTEDDIHEVYESTHQLQTELVKLREKEEYLRKK